MRERYYSVPWDTNNICGARFENRSRKYHHGGTKKEKIKKHKPSLETPKLEVDSHGIDVWHRQPY
jgi:hypothetical protein